MMFYETDDEDICFLRLKHQLFHLSIREAAELISVDMWVAGQFPDINEPEDWGGNDRDPILLTLLADPIKQFEGRIIAAVDSGRLKAKNITRNFDEVLIENRARIRLRDLDAWLSDHGYETGEVVTEWMQTEAEIEGKLEEQFEYLRALSRDSKGVIEDLPVIRDFFPIRSDDVDYFETENDIKKIVAAYKALVISHDRLARMAYGDSKAQPTKEHDAKIDRPLTTRQRRTLLTIIAAFCKYERIDPKARDAVGKIVQMTEDLGARVSEDTVRGTLAELPDALASRMK